MYGSEAMFMPSCGISLKTLNRAMAELNALDIIFTHTFGNGAEAYGVNIMFFIGHITKTTIFLIRLRRA